MIWSRFEKERRVIERNRGCVDYEVEVLNLLQKMCKENWIKIGKVCLCIRKCNLKEK